MARWTWAAASSRGTAHIRSSTRRQDAYSCRISSGEQNAFLAVVADGAGSALMGGQGASIVCRAIASKAKRLLDAESGLPSDEVVRSWVDDVRKRISDAAHSRDLSSRDFASTLIAVLSLGNESLIAHIGDGSAVVKNVTTGSWEAVSLPEQGEYASTTFFVTDSAPMLRITRHYEAVSAVVVFTDGIERLALNMSTQQAHAPFFQGIIRPLFESNHTGHDFLLSKKLKGYLDSDAINERTDDDKTMVLAICQ